MPKFQLWPWLRQDRGFGGPRKDSELQSFEKESPPGPCCWYRSSAVSWTSPVVNEQGEVRLVRLMLDMAGDTTGGQPWLDMTVGHWLILGEDFNGHVWISESGSAKPGSVPEVVRWYLRSLQACSDGYGDLFIGLSLVVESWCKRPY